MRDARTEAFERVGGRWDVRVLEPSPPAVNEPPWFADDPVEGGQVGPVSQRGVRTWAELCAAEGDDELRRWCEERWLIRAPLQPLPAGFGETRAALHKVAAELVSPVRERATGKIGLRYTFHGFGTPFFGQDRQVRVEDGVLIDGELGRMLDVDRVAARAVGDWFGFATSVLEQVRADADAAIDTPSRVQLWPEHFDVSVDLGPDGRRANFGASPGDDDHPEPYLYVSPWDKRAGPFWNEQWGASLSYEDLLDGADPFVFFRQALHALR
jgi:hypothetical protein